MFNHFNPIKTRGPKSMYTVAKYLHNQIFQTSAADKMINLMVPQKSFIKIIYLSPNQREECKNYELDINRQLFIIFFSKIN